jgi:DNA-binding HxlR family transcriptional regulator
MTLPSTYADRNCSLARTLEVVGERWTLLVVRDAFFGVRRFGDFATRLGIPRAVLTSRLKSLVLEGVLSREADAAGSIEYRLTDKGPAKADRRGAVAGGADQGVTPRDSDADTVTAALSQPHRLLDDIRGLSQAPPPGSRRPSKTGRPSA